MNFSFRKFATVALCLGAFGAQSVAASADSTTAATPPMGWNSWDAYGLTISEAEFKANAQWLAANLKRYGWTYAVVDEGWYLVDAGVKPEQSQFVLSPDGRYLPSPNRYPSAAGDVGFKALAAYTHSLGLEFGIHIIRGIPKQAVAKNLPIAGSAFHAADAADTSDTCPWNTYNYGVKATPAGQAYYDSLAALYASWGVDFLKVDCISSHPYKADEIQMMSEAIKKTGRPIVLSLSPGPSPLDAAEALAQRSQLWRISDDVWDHWAHDPKMSFSQSVSEQFAVAASWAKYAGPGHWPDADMLPIGFLGPRPGEGQARDSRLTHDEQRTLITGWSIFRSPLILGANLTKMDGWTKSLLTNREVIAVNQASTDEHEALREAGNVVWTAKAAGGSYVAVVNLSDQAQQIEYAWNQIGIHASSVNVRDLWQRKGLGKHDRLRVTLAPHASVLYRVNY
jgi:alpha-galactosidase